LIVHVPVAATRPSSAEAPSPAVPGEPASLADVLTLAGEYRTAALKPREIGRRGAPASWAPFRLCAIHALELYLNALLVHSGEPAARIRGLQHSMGARSAKAQALGLVLRKRTVAHLAKLDETREYVVSRYAPTCGVPSPVNRLMATLDQVAIAVQSRCDPPSKS
jgi:hypothetical protein